VVGNEVPPGVVTVTSTEPDPSGDVTVMEVEELMLTLVPAEIPKLTVAPAVKPEPLTITLAPPPAGPPLGLKPVTTGTAV
jgi:hypothetical protein